MDNIEEVNERVRSKSSDLLRRLKSAIHSYNMKHVPSKNNTQPLDKISIQFSKQYGTITRIRIGFKRSGVFRHKGVGKGTKISQVGTTIRKPAEWFNPVVESFVSELSEAVADDLASIAINGVLIR